MGWRQEDEAGRNSVGQWGVCQMLEKEARENPLEWVMGEHVSSTESGFPICCLSMGPIGLG